MYNTCAVDIVLMFTNFTLFNNYDARENNLMYYIHPHFHEDDYRERSNQLRRSMMNAQYDSLAFAKQTSRILDSIGDFFKAAGESLRPTAAQPAMILVRIDRHKR